MKKTAWLLIFLLGIPVAAQTTQPPDKDKQVQKTHQKTLKVRKKAEKSDKTRKNQEKASSTGNASVVDQLLGDEAVKEASDWGQVVKTPRHHYPYLEHHGYFRIRAEGIYRGHLGTDTIVSGKTISTSGMLPPLTDNGANRNSANSKQVGPQNEDWIGGVNIRFRYAPILHITRGLQIHGEFDVLDNMVLGSTPDYDPTRPDAPLAIFARGQAPLNSLINSLKDPIAVKQAYLQWDITGPSVGGGPLVRFTGGRMAENFGLGMVYNDGEGLDDDYGTYVDRLQLLFATGRWFVKGAFGWTSSGPTSASPKWPLGQAYDLTDKDDVVEGMLTFGYQAKTRPQMVKDRRRLIVMNKPVVDTALHLVYRHQNLDISKQSLKDLESGKVDPMQTGKTGYDSIQLVPRHAWTLVPDLWFRLRYKPDYRKLLRIEFELASVIGNIGHTGEGTQDHAMSIRSLGAAFEGAFTTGSFTVGVNTGVASGDNSPYFGVLDASKLQGAGNTFSAFYFNPDYRVDLLMFRHVIGTITDAFYFDPYFTYDAFEKEEDALGARLDLVYGRALYGASTPSGDKNLGVELQLKAFYKSSDRFFADLEWDVLWPLSAFNLKAGYMGSAQNRSCHWSTILRGRLGVRF